MSFEEEFDKIIRRKAEEEKYPFDEGNWSKASQLLNAERQATRTLKFKQFYLPAALVVVFGTLGLLTFNYLNEDNKELTQEVKTILPSEEKRGDEKINPPSASKIEKPAEQADINEFSRNAPLATDQIQQSEISIAKVSTHSKKSTVVKPALNDIGTLNEDSKEQNSQTVISHNDYPPVSASISEIPSGTVSENNDRENTPETLPENQPDNVINHQDEIPVEIAPPIANEQISEELNAEQLTTVYSTFPFELMDGSLIQTPFVFLKRYEDDYFKPGKRKDHYLNVEAGANYLLGWDTKNGKDGAGFNWFGGFNYGRYISNKISISIGLQAYNIANIKQPFYLVSSKAYDFGSTDIYTRVTSNQLYFVSVPLKFNYALNNTNTIGFGLNAGYLINAKNTVSKYYVLDNEEKMINPVSTDREIYKGTSMTNVILSANYNTKLNDRFAINAEFNYGLTDLFKNMGEIRNNEKSMGIRIAVNYTLFDK